MALLLIEVTEDVEGRAVRAQDGHTHAVGERNNDRANVLALATERDIWNRVNESVMHCGENVHHAARDSVRYQGPWTHCFTNETPQVNGFGL